MDEKNCPFYGRAYFEGQRGTVHPPFVLFNQRGNQCALITNRHAPCAMEIDLQPVDWRKCGIVANVRGELDV